eukprot:2192112-Amphidinium_carterae.1
MGMWMFVEISRKSFAMMDFNIALNHIRGTIWGLMGLQRPLMSSATITSVPVTFFERSGADLALST